MKNYNGISGVGVESATENSDPNRTLKDRCHLEGPVGGGTVTDGPSLLPGLDQLVTAERLREIIWDSASRPSLQWIRKETKRRALPHIRRGRLIFYRPRSVMEWFSQRESKPASMKYAANK